VRTEDLGGSNYTAYTDDEFIYVLMQPGGDRGAIGGASQVASGEATVLRPYWVAKIDPENWEVVAEYPYRGYRGDWIIIDSKSEYLYVPAAGSSNVTKININTGEIPWSTPTGTGPYGGTLNADETELWVSNKGESTGAFGRTLTVIDTASGRPVDTVFSGYMADHVLLSPSGKEMWVTSNGEGRIYVFDAESHEQLKVIDMPHRGDPHGLVWVKYDEDGTGRVVRDQGGFHNGVHPARGMALVD
jgi:DNA-binding beta-propeller fold protein YncE